ncbi:hypothetical protein KSP40_PGU019339 [Platanthera guangdongensis]|uniref:Photosystem II 5 kDa protein, chloroplastic n=1 Tax=Platanthera guangdongensis TaxID=2320717 RepID=A0ABR2MIS3_9ASPA
MSLLTMTASFLGYARPSPSVNQRTFPAVKAAVRPQEAAVPATADRILKESSSRRRGMMIEAAVAATTAICAAGLVPGMAAAAEEPKRGTPEAKKQYAPICVTMPTARICQK